VKLRLSGTRQECARFVAELVAATPPGVVREVSAFYANRSPSLLGRVYLDLALPDAGATDPDDGDFEASVSVPPPRPAPRATTDMAQRRNRRGRWGR
jgi:hypothetical protein